MFFWLLVLGCLWSVTLSLSDSDAMKALVGPFSSSCGHSSWGQADPCSWAGIICNGSNSVVSFAWSSQACTGELNLSLLPLGLETLYLDNNNLFGQLDFTTLPVGLRDLRLNNNNFSGAVDLTSLPEKMETLMLQSNSFNSSLNLSQLPASLKFLLLDNNMFSGTLDLTALPVSMSEFTCPFNSFDGSLNLLTLPSSLLILDISSNALTGVTDFSKLPSSLTSVRMSNNALEGNLFAAALPSNLVELLAENNLLSGYVDMTQLPSTLKTLSLHSNRLSGALNLSNVPVTLNTLDLHNNSLTGSLILTNLSGSMEMLYLHQNQLEGAVDLSTLPSGLQELRLEENQFSGSCILNSLPASLTKLNISSNFFNGAVDLTQLPDKLKRIDISSNNFVGPLDLTNLPSNLLHLAAHNNNFTGLVELSKLPSVLSNIDVSYNLLTGTLNVSALPYWLSHASFSHNMFSGALDLSRLNELLQEFSAANNNFTGLLDLSSLPSLMLSLDLRNNHFTTVDLTSLPSTMKIVLLDGNEFQWLDLSTLPTGIGIFSAVQEGICGPGFISVSCSAIILSSLCICDDAWKIFRCGACTASISNSLTISVPKSFSASHSSSLSGRTNSKELSNTRTLSFTGTDSHERSPSSSPTESRSPSPSSSTSDSMRFSSSPSPTASPAVSFTGTGTNPLSESASCSRRSDSLRITPTDPISTVSVTPSTSSDLPTSTNSLHPSGSRTVTLSLSRSNSRLSATQSQSPAATFSSTVSESTTRSDSTSVFYSFTSTPSRSKTTSESVSTASFSFTRGTSSFSATSDTRSRSMSLTPTAMSSTLALSDERTSSSTLNSSKSFSFTISRSFTHSTKTESTTLVQSSSNSVTPSLTFSNSTSRSDSSSSEPSPSLTPEPSPTFSPTGTISNSTSRSLSMTQTEEGTATETLSATMTNCETQTASQESSESISLSKTCSKVTHHQTNSISETPQHSQSTSSSSSRTFSLSPEQSDSSSLTWSESSQSLDMTSSLEAPVPVMNATYPILFRARGVSGRRFVLISPASKSRSVTLVVARAPASSQFALYLQAGANPTLDYFAVNGVRCANFAHLNTTSCAVLAECATNPLRFFFSASAPWLYPTTVAEVHIEIGPAAAVNTGCGIVTLFTASDTPIISLPLSYYIFFSNDTIDKPTIDIAEIVQLVWGGTGTVGVVSRMLFNTSSIPALEGITFLPLGGSELSTLRMSIGTHTAVYCKVADVQSYEAITIEAGHNLGRNFSFVCASGAFVDLQLQCDADGSCGGYITALIGEQEVSLCLLYEGVGLDPYISYKRLMYRKPSIRSRTCTVVVAEAGRLQVFVQSTYLASSTVSVVVGTYVLAVCGESAVESDGFCERWTLCYEGVIELGTEIGVVAAPSMKSGGCGNALGALFVFTNNFLQVSPTPSGPSYVTALPSASVAVNVVLQEGEETASVYILNINMIQLAVAQTGFSCDGNCPLTMVTLNRQNGDIRVPLQHCGGSAGFALDKAGVSNQCATRLFCGPPIRPRTLQLGELTVLPNQSDGLAPLVGLPMSIGTWSGEVTKELFSGWISITANTSLIGKLSNTCRFFSATLLASGPDDDSSGLLHGFIFHTDSANARPLLLVPKSSNGTAEEIPFLFSSESFLGQFKALLINTTAVPLLPGSSTFGCFVDFAFSAITYCTVPVPENATSVQVTIGQGRFNSPGLVVAVDLISSQGDIWASTGRCGGEFGFSGDASLDFECDVFALCYDAHLLSSVAIVRLQIPREVVAQSPCPVPFAAVVAFRETVSPILETCTGFSCLTGSSCLSLQEVCDGIRNCPDGSDESTCDFWTKIEENMTVSGQMEIFHRSSWTSCRSVAVANGTTVFAFGPGGCLVYSSAVANAFLNHPQQMLVPTSGSDLYALLLGGPLSYPHCTNALCNHNGEAFSTFGPSSQACSCTCNPGFTSSTCDVTQAAYGWQMVVVRNATELRATERTLGAACGPSLILDGATVNLCKARAPLSLPIDKLLALPGAVSTIPPFSAVPCELEGSLRTCTLSSRAIVRIKVSSSSTVQVIALTKGAVRRSSLSLCDAGNTVVTVASGCALTVCTIQNIGPLNLSVRTIPSVELEDPCFSLISVDSSPMPLRQTPLDALSVTSLGPAAPPLVEVGSALAAAAALLIACSSYLFRKSAAFSMPSSVLLTGLVLGVLSVTIIMSAPRRAGYLTQPAVLVEIFAQPSCAGSAVSPQPLASVQVGGTCQRLVSTDSSLRLLFGKAICDEASGTLSIVFGVSASACEGASLFRVNQGTCFLLEVEGGAMNLFSSAFCTTATAVSDSFSRFSFDIGDSQSTFTEPVPKSTQSSRFGAGFAEYKRCVRTHPQLLHSRGQCRFETAVDLIDLGEAFVSSERFLSVNGSVDLGPRDGDYPVGFTYGTRAPTPPVSDLGRSSSRYFGIEGSLADVGQHIILGAIDGRSGFTITFYLKADWFSVGFPFAVVDGRVLRDGRSVLIERLWEVMSLRQPEASWRRFSGSVYTAVFVNGEEKLVTLVWADRTGVVRQTWSVPGAFDTAWHHVGLVVRRVNGMFTSTLIFDGDTQGEIDLRLRTTDTRCISQLPPRIESLALGQQVPVSDATRERVWANGMLFAGYFRGGVAHVDFSSAAVTAPVLWQPLAPRVRGRAVVDVMAFAYVGIALVLFGVIAGIAVITLTCHRCSVERALRSSKECARRFEVLSGAASAQGYSAVHWDVARRWLALDASDFGLVLEALEGLFPNNAPTLLISLMYCVAKKLPQTWEPPDEAIWREFVESGNAGKVDPPTLASTKEPLEALEQPSQAEYKNDRSFLWLWPLLGVQCVYLWQTALLLPSLFEDYLAGPISLASFDVNRVADVPPYSSPLLQFVLAGCMICVLPLALVILRPAAPASPPVANCHIPVFDVAASVSIDGVRRGASPFSSVVDAEGFSYELKQRVTNEPDELPVDITDSGGGSLPETIRLVEVGNRCVFHPRRYLGMKAFCGVTCAVVRDHKKCDCTHEAKYLCGEQLPDGSSCPFALCQKHFPRSPLAVLRANVIGYARSFGHPASVAASAVVHISMLLFTPVLRSSFMLLTKHPYFRCPCEKWDENASRSGSTVVVGVCVAALFGAGLPAVVWAEANWRRCNLMGTHRSLQPVPFLLLVQAVKVAVAVALAPQLSPIGRIVAIALSELLCGTLSTVTLVFIGCSWWQCACNAALLLIFLGLQSLSTYSLLQTGNDLGMLLVTISLLYAVFFVAVGIVSALRIPILVWAWHRRRHSLLKRLCIQDADESRLYILATR